MQSTSREPVSITAIEAIPVRLPWARAYSTSAGAYPGDRVVIRINTDVGLVGVAEGMTSPTYGETAAIVASVVQEKLAPAVLTHPDPMAIDDHVLAMDRCIKHLPMAKAAVEVALHDLAAKIVGLSVSQYLGASSIKRIELAWPVGLAAPDVMAEDAADAARRGFRTMKLKIGGRPAAVDLEAVRAVRAAVGPEARIRVDANGEYIGRLETLRKMVEEDLELIEQPTRTVDSLKRYATALDTPVMADESVTTPEEVFEVARRQAVEVVKIQLRHQGGFRKTRAIAAIVQAAGLRLYSEGPIETSLGTAASAHLVASLPSLDLSLRPLLGMGLELFSRDLATTPVQIDHGVLQVPQGPGLGVELNEDAVDDLRIK